MTKGRLNELLVHPLFISLIIWGIISIFIPPIFSKYKITHIGDKFTHPLMSFFYYDLDSDEVSEEISFDLSDTLQTKIIIRKENKIINEYDLEGQPRGHFYLYVNDYNYDGFKECYVFTLNKDSILLNIIDPFKLNKITLQNRLIDYWSQVRKSTDAPVVVPVGMIKNESYDCSDLIFYINAGFSKQPRKLYRYIIVNDSLIKSPESCVVITKCTIRDVNRDKVPEFILDVSATGNFDEKSPFSDLYSWLMVLDKNLNFLFPPVKLSRKPSRLVVSPFVIGDKALLLTFQDYYGNEQENSCFYLFDSNGGKVFEKRINDLTYEYSFLLPGSDSSNGTFYFIKNRTTEIDEIDNNLKVKRSFDFTTS